MEEWPIEYEGIHLVCFKCGKYGHRHENCGQEETNQDGQESHRKENDKQSAGNWGSEKYGSWMLVSRRDRGYRNRAANNRREGPQTERRQVPRRDTNRDGLGTQSRYQTASMGGYQSTNRGGYMNSNRGGYQSNYGGSRGRGGRSGFSNQAAAESEHTVVRGSNRGQNITTTVVQHAYGQPDFSAMAEFECSPKEDPPDRGGTRFPDFNFPDVAMDEFDGRNDPTGVGTDAHLRS
nr:uncharacterized protein LOC109147318 [Ipomoea batatas]